jgi:hypothetical protein
MKRFYTRQSLRRLTRALSLKTLQEAHTRQRAGQIAYRGLFLKGNLSGPLCREFNVKAVTRWKDGPRIS